jgi:hypothetical protein
MGDCQRGQARPTVCVCVCVCVRVCGVCVCVCVCVCEADESSSRGGTVHSDATFVAQPESPINHTSPSNALGSWPCMARRTMCVNLWNTTRAGERRCADRAVTAMMARAPPPICLTTSDPPPRCPRRPGARTERTREQQRAAPSKRWPSCTAHRSKKTVPFSPRGGDRAESMSAERERERGSQTR